MPIYVGDKEIKGVYIGNNEAKAIYTGTNQVYPNASILGKYVFEYDGSGTNNYWGAYPPVYVLYKPLKAGNYQMKVQMIWHNKGASDWTGQICTQYSGYDSNFNGFSTDTTKDNAYPRVTLKPGQRAVYTSYIGVRALSEYTMYTQTMYMGTDQKFTGTVTTQILEIKEVTQTYNKDAVIIQTPTLETL